MQREVFHMTGKPSYEELELRIRDMEEEVSAHEKNEKGLQIQKAYLEQLLECAPEGILLADKNHRIIRTNAQFTRLFGYPPEETIGRIADDLIAPPQKFNEASDITLRVGRGEPIRVETARRRKDGRLVFVELMAAPVWVGDEHVADYVSYRDITERKRSEKEMADLQEQLRQSQKMEGLGRLAGGIAHDFNNLLTVIKGYADLSLLHLKEGDALWSNIKEIDRASERAKDLTRQLLAFGRRQILQVKVLDLNSLVLDLEKMLRRILGEDIQLLTTLAEDLGRVRVDPGEIEQVIMNLAVNARDAMSSGGRLTIETTNVELDEDYARVHVGVTPGPYVMLSVSDTGVGMSREVQEKAFEPFFTTKETGKGTGLGLSTVYGIVKQSGGNIWIESEPGKGTTFKIYLPKVEGALDPLHRRGDSASLREGTEVVLLVEDETPVLDLVARFLRHQGYAVLEAADGEQALRIAEAHGKERIHLLLTDVVMPKMSGRELADRLKSLRPDLKVLFISGYTDNAIVRHGVLDAGVNFLQKPFSVAALGQKIRGALDGSEAR
jgi:two-component system, cell cycle sensor histidine kinase and response regulator CckA